jgi:hypothetical protein
VKNDFPAISDDLIQLFNSLELLSAAIADFEKY